MWFLSGEWADAASCQLGEYTLEMGQAQPTSWVSMDRVAHGSQDGDAVRAALLFPWSNAQTEGQIMKLKLLKRQMYGRANFDLLRRRALLIS